MRPPSSAEPAPPWIDPAGTRGLVSVIVPVYNRVGCAIDTLASVRRQTYRPIELIVVDDGSSDGSVELVERWVASLDASDLSARFIRQANAGPSAARNLGVRHATGEFIQFLDSDDLLHPRKLADSLAAFDGLSVDMVVANYDRFASGDEISALLARDPQPNPFRRDPERPPFITHMRWDLWQPLYRRSLIARAGPAPEHFRFAETFAHTCLLKAHSTGRRYLPSTLLFYRTDTANAQTRDKAELRLTHAAVAIRYVCDTLTASNVTDPAEWRELCTRALRTYRHAVQQRTDAARRPLIEIIRETAPRWNRLAGLAAAATPEFLLRAANRLFTSVGLLRR